MLLRSLTATAITILASASSAPAQPPGRAAPVRRPASAEGVAGHTGLLVGAGLFVGQIMDDPPRESSGGYEFFLGWSFGRFALAGWHKLHLDDGDQVHIDMGGAARVWPLLPYFRRFYAEVRAGAEKWGERLDCEDGCNDNEDTGAVVGAALGFELVSFDRFTLDLRAGLLTGFLLDGHDYSMAELGLALNVY
jgi:hypothetical protein